MNDAQLLQLINDLIQSGGNNTSADDIRQVLSDIVNNKFSSASNDLEINNGVVVIDGNRVVAGRQNFVSDAVTNHNLNAVYDPNEVGYMLDELGVIINAIINRLVSHGLINPGGV